MNGIPESELLLSTLSQSFCPEIVSISEVFSSLSVSSHSSSTWSSRSSPAPALAPVSLDGIESLALDAAEGILSLTSGTSAMLPSWNW